jgi:hypothetical protein
MQARGDGDEKVIETYKSKLLSQKVTLNVISQSFVSQRCAAAVRKRNREFAGNKREIEESA